MESAVLDLMSNTTPDIGLNLDSVKVDYPIYDSNATLMQRRLLNLVSLGRAHRKLGNIHVVQALKDITIDFLPGSAVGLIGRNGAGKSTMLKLLAGVLEPSLGTISRRGSITALLTINSGMEIELDGYENIRRLGLLRGFTVAEIEAMTPDVVAFAQLGDFISLPIRTYSSGMRMRLAFGIATLGTPDILLIDEVFGAGDQSFLARAHERISGLLERSKIIVLSTHSTELIREFCTSCLYLEQGEIRAHGETGEVLELYEKDSRRAQRKTA